MHWIKWGLASLHVYVCADRAWTPHARFGGESGQGRCGLCESRVCDGGGWCWVFWGMSGMVGISGSCVGGSDACLLFIGFCYSSLQCMSLVVFSQLGWDV